MKASARKRINERQKKRINERQIKEDNNLNRAGELRANDNATTQ